MGGFVTYLMNPGALQYPTERPTTSNRYRSLGSELEQPPSGHFFDTSAEPFPRRDQGQVTGPMVAVVIDDVGWSRRAVPVYESIREPLTFAVLPGRPHSQSVYERWESRFEFIVHMPMEPVGYPADDPGKLALMTSMKPDEVKSRLQTILDGFPEVSGINNHMGSKFTQNRKLMDVVMGVLSARAMFYMDSLTTTNSVAATVARSNNVPVVRNDVYLDNRKSRKYIRQQLQHLVEVARKQGQAIGIGHFQSIETARVLERLIPRYKKKGISFVTLSQLVKNQRRSRPGRREGFR